MPSERCSDVVDATGASVTVGHDGSGIVRRQKATIARAAGVDLAASIVLVGVICIEIVAKFWVGGVIDKWNKRFMRELSQERREMSTKVARRALTVSYDENIPYHGLRVIDVVVASNPGAHTKSPILVTKHSKVGYASAETSTKDSMNKIGIAAGPRVAVICTKCVDLDVKSS